MRQCPRCRIEKELTEFYKNKANSFGVCSWCKLCTNQYSNEKAAVIRANARTLLGNRGVRCGIEDPRVLTIDHIYGGGTQERKRTSAYSYYLEITKDPIRAAEKFQILCWNCNHLKRLENGEHTGQRLLSN